MSMNRVGRIEGIQNYPTASPYHTIESQLQRIGSHKAVPLPAGMSIIFVNGMLNGELDAKVSIVAISERIGNKKVELVFNDTNNALATAKKLADRILEEGSKCGDELNRLGLRTNDICILIIAHSHGASILSQALEDERLVALLKQMRIITIGGAALIPSFSPYRSVENLINEYDLLPLFAHSTCDAGTLFKDDPILDFFAQAFVGIKKIMQENVLMISSHKIQPLADRILSEMQCSWETTPEETSSQKLVKAFLKDINKSSKRTLGPSTSSKKELGNFFGEVLTATMAHFFYKIEILKTGKTGTSLQTYFEDCHSVESYLPRLSQLVIGYIGNHENLLNPLAAS